MPLHKHHHKKKSGYWFKKWLYKVRIGLNLQKHRFQKSPTDIVFLTTEEVKASLAASSVHKPVNFSADSSSRPDPSILPQKNRSHRKSRNVKRSRFNRFLYQISFGILGKAHSSASHHLRNRTIIADTAPSADAGFKDINGTKKSNDNSTNQEFAPIQSQRRHRRKHIHKSRFSRLKSTLMRKLNFANGKSGFNHPFNFENSESSLPIPEKKIPWTDYIKPTLTSTAMFLVAYQLSWFFYQLAVMIMASFFKIDSVLFYYEVMFPEGSDSLKWTPEKIIIITLAGPLCALAVWIILRFILKIKSRYGSHLRMFLVWLYLISMMLFFGAFVGGAITLEGFGYVIDWLFMSIALRLILSVVFISIIIALSWNVVSFMPETTRSHSWKNNRYKYILSRLIVPWFIGTGIMTILKITKNITQHENIFDYDIINLATLAFAVVPPLFNSLSRPQLYRRRKVNQRLKAELPVLWIAGAIFLVVLFRIVLSYGVYFRLIFDLDINFYH
jgi:hypothetical protein